MKPTIHQFLALAASVLLCGVCAAAASSPAPAHRASAAQPAASAAKAATAAKAAAKAAARQRAAASSPVDINTASKVDLMKLPDITEADAQRIIAGRPYLTKAHLVTHKIIAIGTYQRINSMIMARQPRAGNVMTAASRSK